MITLMFNINVFSQATYTSQADGNWGSASTWSISGTDSDSNGIPDSNDAVVIGHDVTVSDAQAANTVTVNFSGSPTLTISGTSSGLTTTSDFTNNSDVIITGGAASNPATLTVNGDLQQDGNLTVGAGQRLVMGASSNINARGTTTINSGSSSYGSLYFYGTYTQQLAGGKVSYRRYVNSVAGGWDLISVPIASLNIANWAANENDLATNTEQYAIGVYTNTTAAYNSGSGSGADTWVNYTTSTAGAAGDFTPGKGYQMASQTGAEMTFSGVPNTGSVSIGIINSETGVGSENDASDGSAFNLVGNPYPSFLSVEGILGGNSSVLGWQALYGYTGSGGNYQTYNNATGGFVAPGQGFMVPAEANTSANFTFTTSMQSTSNTSMDDFISGDATDDNRAELFIGFNSNESSDRTRIYFIENMTDGYDNGYDAPKISLANNFISSRLVNNDEGYDIDVQSLAYSDLWDKTIPLVVNSQMGNEITLSITHNTAPADLNIYLEDVLEGSVTDLKAGDFVLTPSADLEGVGRFFIHMSADTMSNEDVSTSMLNAYKEVNANYITIEGLATQSNNINVSLYNILGTKLLDTSLSNSVNTQTLSTVGMASGIYVIELESGNDRLTKKLIIQ